VITFRNSGTSSSCFKEYHGELELKPVPTCERGL